MSSARRVSHRVELRVILFFKQKTAYELRISDWSSDVCSSDLGQDRPLDEGRFAHLDTGSLERIELLERELEAERGTSQIEQDQDTVRTRVQGRPERDRKSVV